MKVLENCTVVSRFDWKWWSGWLESWEALLMTDVSTNCAEAIFRVTRLWRWLQSRLLKHPSPTTILRTPNTQMIIFNQVYYYWVQIIFLFSSFMVHLFNDNNIVQYCCNSILVQLSFFWNYAVRTLIITCSRRLQYIVYSVLYTVYSALKILSCHLNNIS